MNNLLAIFGINFLATTKPDAAKEQFDTILAALKELGGLLWVYFALAAAALVLVWAVYIGIKYAMANKQEDRINAKSLITQLIVGTIIIAVVVMAVPALITGLIAWTGATVPATSAVVSGIL